MCQFILCEKQKTNNSNNNNKKQYKTNSSNKKKNTIVWASLDTLMVICIHSKQRQRFESSRLGASWSWKIQCLWPFYITVSACLVKFIRTRETEPRRYDEIDAVREMCWLKISYGLVTLLCELYHDLSLIKGTNVKWIHILTHTFWMGYILNV